MFRGLGRFGLILFVCSISGQMAFADAAPAAPALVPAAVSAPAAGAVIDPEANFSAADTAWMLVSAALVLMMTAPGLALFYSGLVRKKNVLGVMMQCVFLMGVMSVVWAIYGYSLAFAPDKIGRAHV